MAAHFCICFYPCLLVFSLSHIHLFVLFLSRPTRRKLTQSWERTQSFLSTWTKPMSLLLGNFYDNSPRFPPCYSWITWTKNVFVSWFSLKHENIITVEPWFNGGPRDWQKYLICSLQRGSFSHILLLLGQRKSFLIYQGLH